VPRSRERASRLRDRGEETLDLDHALEQSSITFIPVRHEQGNAYMALALDVPSLVVLPIDYSIDVAISDEQAVMRT
jgi:hypothetical protein